MSSAVEPAREPQNAEPADPAAGSRKRQRAFVVGSLAALLVATVCVVFYVRAKSGRNAGSSSLSGPVQTQSQNVLRLRGMTAAVQARSIQAPLIAGQQVGTLTITRLTPSGTRVKQGDLLVEFDRQAQLRDSSTNRRKATTKTRR